VSIIFGFVIFDEELFLFRLWIEWALFHDLG